MAVNDGAMWGIHGGKTGDADSLFLKRNRIGLGWTTLGNLLEVKADREAFKALVAAAYKEKTPMGIANNAGQLFRFVHELKTGDIVVYPSQRDKQIHVGRVQGAYVYDPAMEAGYPHQRPITWLKSFPRTHFSQGALQEAGSAMSFFQIRNYADEYRAALEAKAEAPTQIAAKDETVGLVAGEIEQTTRDFVVKELARELKGHPFADFVADLLRAMGYRTRVSPPGPDGGIDIIAHKDELGFVPPIVKAQVKSGEGNIGEPEVSALFGKIGSDEFGLFVTLGGFTSQARNFAKSKSKLRLVDGDELVDLVLAHYDQLDSRYKGLIPLKHVYVPDPPDESEI